MKFLKSNASLIALVGWLAAGCASEKREDRLLSFDHAKLGSTYTVGVYVIAKGDSCASICQRFNLSTKDLLALNPGLDPRRLRIGRTIRVYQKQKA